jgi:hypothetical protein
MGVCVLDCACVCIAQICTQLLAYFPGAAKTSHDAAAETTGAGASASASVRATALTDTASATVADANVNAAAAKTSPRPPRLRLRDYFRANCAGRPLDPALTIRAAFRNILYTDQKLSVQIVEEEDEDEDEQDDSAILTSASTVSGGSDSEAVSVNIVNGAAATAADNDDDDDDDDVMANLAAAGAAAAAEQEALAATIALSRTQTHANGRRPPRVLQPVFVHNQLLLRVQRWSGTTHDFDGPIAEVWVSLCGGEPCPCVNRPC